MDGIRFGTLTRMHSASRRGTLQMLLLAVAGSAAVTFGGSKDPALAACKCKTVGQKCDKNSDCCKD